MDLNLPGKDVFQKDNSINSPITPGTNIGIKDATLGALITGFLDIAFLIAGFLLFFWLVWGVFQYLFAGGNKERLGQARTRLTWAFIGFIIVILAFSVSKFVQGIFPIPSPQNQTINQITPP
ncbi:hypothetical protein HYS91_01815 [Candidatus Daviesbacteria bacterium]|nr:hypothetical protein [Candidatus Daviesbacteria bacterium]